MSGMNVFKTLTNYKYIFVDFFDTLVFRTKTILKMKHCWAQELSSKLHFIISPDELLQMRATSESLLSKHSSEFHYDELAKNMYRAIMAKNSNLQLNEEEFCDYAKQIEEDVEMRNQFANNELVSNLRIQKKNGKKIILVSDFYLGLNTYEKFFAALNIQDVFDSVYISCDYNASKSSGALYKRIIKENNLGAEDIIMIGDNKISDFIVPQSLGLSAIHYANKAQIKYYGKQNKKTNKHYFYKIFNMNGDFGNYAFSLYLFCDGLYKKCVNSNISQLVFLSREGAILKKLFDEFKSKKAYKIDTKYAYVSRNSTFIASLNELEQESFQTIFREYKSISLHEFLNAICFNAEEIKMLSLASIDTKINDFQNSNEFAALKSNTLFINLYDKKRKEQKKNLRGYFARLGVDFTTTMNIVDVGWKGSMQDNLYKAFDNELAIHGFYLGCLDWGNFSKANDKEGVLFDYSTHRDVVFSDIFMYDYIDYEFILSAGHGKTIGYTDDNEPILINDEDIIAHEKYVAAIQSNIWSKFLAISAYFENCVMQSSDISEFEYLHKKMLKCMKMKEISILYNVFWLHRDSFLMLKYNCRRKFLWCIKKKVKQKLRVDKYFNKKYGIKRSV